LDDGSTTDERKVKVKMFYEKKSFSIAVEAADGFEPNRHIDIVEIHGLPAIPSGIKFTDSVTGKYKAHYTINHTSRSVIIHGLDIKITGEELEKT